MDLVGHVGLTKGLDFNYEGGLGLDSLATPVYGMIGFWPHGMILGLDLFVHTGGYWVWNFCATWVDIGFGSFWPRGWILGLDF